MMKRLFRGLCPPPLTVQTLSIDTGVNTGRIEPFTFKNNDLSQGSSNCSSNYSLRSRKKAPNDPVTIDICSDEEEHSTPSVRDSSKSHCLYRVFI